MADLLRRWPQLLRADRIAAVSVMMSGLDSVAAAEPFRRHLHRPDPYEIAASVLPRLNAVDAVDGGFQGILQRINQQPLDDDPSSYPFRETNLCEAIPMLPARRRLSAFDQMIETFETRFRPEAPGRQHFLASLAPIVFALNKRDQAPAIDRLLRLAADINDAPLSRKLLEGLPLARLKTPLRPLLDKLVAVALDLPKQQLGHLLFPGWQTVDRWIAAVDQSDRAYARAQVERLRERLRTLA